MFNLSHPKLVTLAETEGCAEVADFLEDYALDSIVPAICMAPNCDHTADLEPDQRADISRGLRSSHHETRPRHRRDDLSGKDEGLPMTHYRYTTPGSRLTWSDVGEWVDAAHRIGRRRLSAARNRAFAAHAAALPRELIDRETHIPSLEAALHLLKYGHPSLARPQRGHRADHPTTPVIMDLMNRLAVLKRRDEIPAGDNWTAMFGGSDAHSG